MNRSPDQLTSTQVNHMIQTWYSSKAKKIKTKRFLRKLPNDTMLDGLQLLPYKPCILICMTSVRIACFPYHPNQNDKCTMIKVMQLTLTCLYNEPMNFCSNEHMQQRETIQTCIRTTKILNICVQGNQKYNFLTI